MHMVKKLVKCEKNYWEFVRILRNDNRVKDGFIQRTYITKSLQKKYMSIYNDSYRICILHNIPVGFIGVIKDDIRICTHPDYQKKGIGLFMLKKIKKEFPTAVGKIKIDNISSINLFIKAGFRLKYYIYK